MELPCVPAYHLLMLGDPAISDLAPRFAQKRFVIVDDRQDAINMFLPLLTQEGALCLGILHPENQGEAELAERIVKSKADVVLLDGNLSGDVRGARMVPTLKSRMPKAKIIGFSSAESLRETFMSVDADGFVFKNMDSPEETINDLAWIL